MKMIDIIFELMALENRIAESERAISDVISGSLLDCAAWHDSQAEKLRRFVLEYPRKDRMSASEAAQLDASLTMANRHERWAREIKQQSKQEGAGAS